MFSHFKCLLAQVFTKRNKIIDIICNILDIVFIAFIYLLFSFVCAIIFFELFYL